MDKHYPGIHFVVEAYSIQVAQSGSACSVARPSASVRARFVRCDRRIVRVACMQDVVL